MKLSTYYVIGMLLLVSGLALKIDRLKGEIRRLKSAENMRAFESEDRLFHVHTNGLHFDLATWKTGALLDIANSNGFFEVFWEGTNKPMVAGDTIEDMLHLPMVNLIVNVPGTNTAINVPMPIVWITNGPRH